MTSKTSDDMTTYTFDTLTYVKELVAAGMPEPQAEVILLKQKSLMESELATKTDLRNLERVTKAEIEALEHFTKAELKKLELSTKTEIKALEQFTRAELKALESSTRRDLQQMELRLTHDLTLRLGSMMVISVGAAASLATLI
ncbi:MAG: hypothetical protein QF806_00970 [Pseudomonadales bacterium]|nr:hypothetical protein [Pseudomonadales bacterium]